MKFPFRRVHPPLSLRYNLPEHFNTYTHISLERAFTRARPFAFATRRFSFIRKIKSMLRTRSSITGRCTLICLSLSLPFTVCFHSSRRPRTQTHTRARKFDPARRGTLC